jgi:glycosyltransferase involved in cell wall biosynthesis
MYDLRLKLSLQGEIMRLAEFLYTEVEMDTRASGDKMFDYVNPANRAVQIEMEKACTQYLKDAGAYLEPKFEDIDFTECDFPVEASVIIPVRNRVRTIADAVKSVLMQKTSFPFNLIVVDNLSTDGTTEILKELAATDDRLVHIIPEREDLGIGGCWNRAIMDARCGKFAVQLDSDDLYIDENTLQKVVDAFYEQKCGAVIGSYKIVNFQLEMLPPGIIDHREWTPDNGRNNGLRINGFGAPRAFYTPMLRSIKLPNTSYGEDYAVVLSISRKYQIGRIYEPLYLCRRWEDNSDGNLSIEKENSNNLFKDRVRTIEFLARQRMNKKN